MADYVFEERRQNYAPRATRPSWGAIWAGVFAFFAIWVIFEVLGLVIFANPVSGIGAGLIVWNIILSIVAMFVAGGVTGYLAGVVDLRDGLTHGMAMFGLSVIGTLALLSQGAAWLAAPAGAENGAHIAPLFTLFSNFGWAGFLALLLGWLAALGGASMGVRRTSVSDTPVRQTRRAA